MTRKSLLLITLCGLLGVAIGLHQGGYWDTWAQYEDELTMELSNSFLEQGAPADLVVPVVACIISSAIKALDDSGCPLPTSRETPMSAAERCLNSDPITAMTLTMAIIECGNKVKAQSPSRFENLPGSEL